MARFTVRLYSDFEMVPQEETRILFESDNLVEVINFIKEYFKYEDYFNAVYFIDNKLNKSGYVGRDLTINCGENLFAFCELPDQDNKFNKQEIKLRMEDVLNELQSIRRDMTVKVAEMPDIQALYWDMQDAVERLLDTNI